MRKIKYIVCHCTATSLTTKVESIEKYWREKLGWKNAGYHFIIDRSGKVTQLQDLDKIANGVRGYNAKAIHVSTIGGKNEDDRTRSQMTALATILKTLKAVYPEAEVLGHRDFPRVSKSCPRYDAKEFWKSIK